LKRCYKGNGSNNTPPPLCDLLSGLHLPFFLSVSILPISPRFISSSFRSPPHETSLGFFCIFPFFFLLSPRSGDKQRPSLTSSRRDQPAGVVSMKFSVLQPLVIGDVQKNLVEGGRKTGIPFFFFLVVPPGTTQLIETGVLENKTKSGLAQGGDLLMILNVSLLFLRLKSLGGDRLGIFARTNLKKLLWFPRLVLFHVPNICLFIWPSIYLPSTRHR